jgi:hypothetical protein
VVTSLLNQVTCVTAAAAGEVRTWLEDHSRQDESLPVLFPIKMPSAPSRALAWQGGGKNGGSGVHSGVNISSQACFLCVVSQVRDYRLSHI